MIARATLTLCIGTALLLAGCEQSATNNGSTTTQPTADDTTLENVAEKTQDAVAAGLEYLNQKKEEYRKRIEPELDRLNERVEKLREQLGDAAEAAKPEIERRMKQLREGVDAAREKLDNLKDASEPAWEEAKRGLDRAIEELHKGLDDVPATQPAELPTTLSTEAPDTPALPD